MNGLFARRDAEAFEAVWQQNTAGMYPIWAFGHLGLVLLFSWAFLPRIATAQIGDLLLMLALVGSIGVFATITFLVWERWDLSLVGKQWIENQENKPRAVLLLILGLRGVSFLSLTALAFRFAVDHSGKAPPSLGFQTIFLATVATWAVIGLISILLLVFPISLSAFKLLNSVFMPRQDREGALKRFAILLALVLILEQVLDRLPMEAAEFRPIAVSLVIGTCFLPSSLASFYGFIILWWNSVSNSLTPK
jgi:hypothetical protein